MLFLAYRSHALGLQSFVSKVVAASSVNDINAQAGSTVDDLSWVSVSTLSLLWHHNEPSFPTELGLLLLDVVDDHSSLRKRAFPALS